MKLGELVPELPITHEPTSKELRRAKKQKKRELLERIGQLKSNAAHEIAHRQEKAKAEEYYSECSCGLFHLMPLSDRHQAVGHKTLRIHYGLKNWQTPVPSREESTLRRAEYMPRQLISMRNAINMMVSLK